MPDVIAASARVADGEVTDLSVGGKIPQQHEVALAALERLRVQARLEHAHIKACRVLDVRDHDVEVVDPRRVERQQALLDSAASTSLGVEQRNGCSGGAEGGDEMTA